ncbi:MAG: class B sortase [Clostridia bacterium]
MNKKIKLLLMLLIVILAISSYFFVKEFAENKKENDLFEDLQEIVQDEEISTNENDNTTILNNETSNLSNENTSNNYNLEKIAKINSDTIGWIKIDGTNINYPVMQNGNYYLHRNIYKNYSSHGTPYLAENCNLRTSDNLIIYGHHMNDNSMFSGLVNYKNYQFYKNHKYINFYTLKDGQTIESSYEIVIAFKTVAYSNSGFKYHNYTNFYDEQELNTFVDNCRNLEFYNTGTKISYGDKLLTLSTCEYSQKNGRMVIIAKKI